MPETLTAVPFYETPEISRAVSPDVARHLGTLMVTAHFNTDSEAPNQTGIFLTRPSESHGRSVDVSGSATASLTEIVGNGTFSLKGAGPYELSAHKALSADRIGWTPTGFMSGEAIERISGVSDFMKRIGVQAEQFLGTAKPNTFPIINKNGEELQVRHMSMNEIYEDIQPGTDIPDGHELIVYARKMITSIRPTDLGNASPKEVKVLIGRLAEDLSRNSDDIEMRFNPNDPESITDYFVRQLPRKLGKSLAKIHDEACAHNSLTPGNITAAGEIVDLDSVTGEPLGFGDKKVLPVDMLGDFYLLIGGLSPDITPIDSHQQFIGKNGAQLQAYITRMSLRGAFDSIESDSPDIVNQRLNAGYKLSAEMVENFLDSYEEAGVEGSLSRTTIKLYREGRKQFEAARAAELSGRVYG